VREVPDHQEVFADVKTDQSVIVELVNMAGVADDEAAVFHFRELASDNDALNEAVVVNVERIGQDNLPNFAAGTVCHAVQGQQRVAKFNERTSAKNLVNIYFAVIRLPHKQVCTLSLSLSLSAAGLTPRRGVVRWWCGGLTRDPWVNDPPPHFLSPPRRTFS
jgi:hypothetical protein